MALQAPLGWERPQVAGTGLTWNDALCLPGGSGIRIRLSWGVKAEAEKRRGGKPINTALLLKLV